MECPKCGYDLDFEGVDCPKCGLIFAKYHSAGDFTNQPSVLDLLEPAGSVSLRELLFSVPARFTNVAVLSRSLLVALLLCWGGYLAFGGIVGNRVGESWLHLVNLPFHEAGHLFFSPFGSFIKSLGGSLGQVLIPLVCMVVLLVKTRDAFGASVTFWWFGENLLDLAPYIADARSLHLPLLGGNTGASSPYGFHDWEFILTELGWLRYDQWLARLCHATGSLVMVVACLWGGYLVWLQCCKIRLRSDMGSDSP